MHHLYGDGSSGPLNEGQNNVLSDVSRGFQVKHLKQKAILFPDLKSGGMRF